MNRKLLASLALAALMIVAGCTGGGGNTTTAAPADSTTTTVPDDPTTPAPTTTTDPSTEPTPTSTPTPVTPNGSIPADAYPSGVSVDGITNATELIDTHNELMISEDFTSQRNTSLLQANESDVNRIVEISEIRSDADSNQALATVKSARTRNSRTLMAETTAYANSTHIISQTTRRNQTTYNVGSADGFESTLLFGNQVTNVLETGTFVPVAASQQGDRTLIRYKLTGINTSVLPQGSTVEATNGSLIVDDRGLVHNLDFNVRISNPSSAIVERTFSLSVTPKDVSIEKPDWLETAIEQAAE